MDKQRLVIGQQKIQQSLAMIAALRSNIEHHLAYLQNDPASLEGASNGLSTEIQQLNQLFNNLSITRFHSLLPDSGVKFEEIKSQEASG